MKSIQVGLFAAIVSVAGTAGAALAAEMPSTQTDIQDIRGQGVADRARPGYDAIGIRYGAFMVYPTLDVTEVYNDNVYATSDDEKSDFITQLSPGFKINSLWGRHSLNLHANLDQYWYARNSSENRTDWNVGTDGRLDVRRDTNVTAAVNYAHLHEDRGSATSPTSAAEPSEYKLFSSTLGLNHTFNRVTAGLSGSYDNYDYSDIRSFAGPMIDQSQRDRSEYGGALKVGYMVSPDTNVYAQGSLNKRSYRQTPPVVSFNRDSDGYAAVVGSDFKLARLVQGGVYVGYQSQSYDNPAFSNDSGVAYGANVNWYITPLTTIRLKGASTIEEADFGGASGYNARSVELGVDHELLRNVILAGDVGYENDDFGNITRKDDVYTAGLGVNYLLNQYLAVGVRYSFTDRSSDNPGTDFTRNLIGITLRGQL